ncbi:MAG: fumarylacetoacetase [Pirellulaceae bacterium]
MLLPPVYGLSLTTMRPIDHTHNPQLTSWIESANAPDSDFPIQNLPFCRFQPDGGSISIGTGIGSMVLDLAATADLFSAELRDAISSRSLKSVMQLPVDQRIALRHRISELLSADCPDLRDDAKLREQALLNIDQVQLVIPVQSRDYTDFYASVFHATNVGSMFRPNNPLLPNYKHVPIGYHGRASSLVVSGTAVKRPVGQLSPAEEGGAPSRGPCKLLDYEMEVGFYVGPGNDLGQTISIASAEDQIFGTTLVNDWSARDMQKWEYQPLGPFLAKSFATSVSPWIVTMEALAPFRCAAFERPQGDPRPLNYLSLDSNESHGGIDLQLQVSIVTAAMREQNLPPHQVSSGSFRDMYWTIAQMLTHHSSNGCNMQPGDLLASGTVSNRDRSSRGCLLEMTWDGDLDNPVPGTQRTAIQFPGGEERKFLADGDSVIMTGFCENDQYRRIGFGTCEGTILPVKN